MKHRLFRKGIEAKLKGIQTVAVAVVRIIERHHVRRSLDHMLMWQGEIKATRSIPLSFKKSPTARPGKSPKAKLKNA